MTLICINPDDLPTRNLQPSGRALAAAGAGREQVAKLTIYVVNRPLWC
ncbi:MAG TPA: hypothetical protein VIY68_06615 [Steroidobacteraceae bacterium]